MRSGKVLLALRWVVVALLAVLAFGLDGWRFGSHAWLAGVAWWIGLAHTPRSEGRHA